MRYRIPALFDGRVGMVLLCILALCLLAIPAWGMQNQLREHASPYLAMHGDDPVAWQDWSGDVLKRAREQDKLIFISSGYFSCHWCHVMQRESYRDPQIASLLNQHFIPVKLDRELHPALDAYLIDYVERTQGHAGWPLNIFLTPEGYPLIGATYVPRERFQTLLVRLDKTWNEQRGKTRNLARRALLQLTAKRRQVQPEPLSAPQLRERLLRQALALGDPMEGGFGEQNKFPMAPQLMALLSLRGERPHKALDTLLQATLDQMAQQGLRDHLAGGFFRYTVDPSWHVPHFEKMLYTQAQLARLYLLAGKIYGREDYLQVARETLDFTLREMRGPKGLLIASFSAVDGQGEEGGPYLWHPQQLQELLGEEDAALAAGHWAMTGAPTVDSSFLPRRGASLEDLVAATGLESGVLRDRLEQIQAKLLAARAGRKLPADTKELAAWNGLMIGALAQAARQLQKPAYGEAATRLARALHARLWQGGELWRARAGDAPSGLASLADYAYLAEGLQLLQQWRDAPWVAAWRDELVLAAWQRFRGPAGWRAAQAQVVPGMGERVAETDGALPAAPAVLLRLTRQLANPALEERLDEALQASRPDVQQQPFWYATHLLALLGR